MTTRTAPPVLSDPEFRVLRDYLLATAGLAFDESRRGSLASVVAERVRATRSPGVASYLALVDSPDGSAERQALLDAVTVQETHFFRNAPQMTALRRRVLPELLRRATGRPRPLTVWSAGCSTGEEPYTLAMMLRRLAPDAADRGRVTVLGTDLSEGALQVARRATYAGRTLQLVPPEARGTGFVAADDGSLTVAEPVRSLVELRQHNLVNDPPPFGPGEVDLVVCRNVTIYFDRPSTRSLIATFHGVLADGGYLLLGHSETLWQVSDDFTLVPVGDAFVYRRGSEPRPRAPRRRQPVAAPAQRSMPAARRPGPAAPTTGPAAPSPADRLAEAAALLASGDYDAAARGAEQALLGDPLLAAAYVVLGRARTALGHDEAAIETLRKAVYLVPGAGEAHLLLAGALARLGQHAAAAVAYRAAAATLDRLDPAAAAALFGGRDLAELADLCRRLAERSARLARDGAPVAAGRVP